MKKRPQPIIALMYHGTPENPSEIPENREPGARLYDVPAENFQQQMGLIKKKKYHVTVGVSPAEDTQAQQVILTFDDGEMNNFTQAYPILKQHQFPALFFVTVNRIGQKGYMDWPQLKELIRGGMTIGSHGLNHEILLNRSEEELQREFMESKEILEESLGVKVAYFSAPRGFFNRQIVDMAREIGYSHIFVSQNGFLPYKNCIGRMPVKGSWSLRRFEEALLGHQPLGDVCGKTMKGLAKKVLGPRAYDGLREHLLGK